MLVSAGESLIDLIALAETDEKGETYRARPGGSPYNCAVAMAKLGGDVGFLCPLSSDVFGETLRKHLLSMGVTPLVKNLMPQPTALAIVSVSPDGQPSYSFYRDETADRQLSTPPIKSALPEVVSAFHFGSLCLANALDARIWLELALSLRQRDVLITLDPNLRPALIDDMDQYRERLVTAYELCDVLKFSDEDLGILYPNDCGYEQLVMLQKKHQIPLVILTKGANGSMARTLDGVTADAPPFPIQTMGDTVGAGDTFQAALVFWLTERFEEPHRQAQSLDAEALTSLLRFANSAAGLTCQEQGCNPPTRENVDTALLSQWWLRHDD